MTTPYTQQEWCDILKPALQDLPNVPLSYDPPRLGTIEFAQCIDHTLLKLDATEEQIDQLCEEARINKFKSVCVRLKWVERAVHKLRGTTVVVACVVGFHEGTYPVSEKVSEASQAITEGASELDMVINYKQLKEKDYSAVYTDIAAVRSIAPQPTILKVILETSQLAQTDIVAVCKIAQAASADFVKTSTGFNGMGATVENVRLMKGVVGDSMKVKASGGIKTVEDCIRMLGAGAERIGASSGVNIMKEAGQIVNSATHNADHRTSDIVTTVSSDY